MPDDVQDIIQIGLGPVGLTMAPLLGQSGHTVSVVERQPNLYGLPRAGHIDHEIVRILQSVGAEGPVMADSFPTTEYVWVNNDGETLLEFDWGAKGISGYNSDYMFYQPVMETALFDRVVTEPTVTLLRGWQAVDFRDGDGYVEVVIRKSVLDPDTSRYVLTDEEQVLRGRYLVGADGAGSAVRRWLGIEREDLGFNERWLDVDVRTKHELSFDFDCGQICDPARPRTVLPLGKRHRRWEWSLLEGETVEEFQTPGKAWELLSGFGVGPDDVDIVRQLVYTFEARTAVQWRRGRAFLVGDAAHTMPPFMGQGMCSGMRDAKNLTWKLDLVLRGLAPESLLDSYQEEMRPYALDWTVISLEAGKVPCITDPVAARERDDLFRSGFRPPMPDFPQVRHGVIVRDDDDRPLEAAGQLGVQGRVTRGDTTELFDRAFEAAGKWQVISTVRDPRSVLAPAQIELLERLGTVFAHLSPDVGGDAVDADGDYAAYLTQRGAEVVVMRPDFYVFGTAAHLNELPTLVDQLQRRLGMASSMDSAYS